MQIVNFENFTFAISNSFKMTTKRDFENFIFATINFKITSNFIFATIDFKITLIFDIDFNFHKTFIFNVNRFQVFKLLIIQSIKNSFISFVRQFF